MLYDENGNIKLSVAQAGATFDDTVKRVHEDGARVVLTRRGKGVAVLVTMQEFRALERLEDEHDARIASKRLKDLRAGKTKAVPWAEVKKKMLRLDRRK